MGPILAIACLTSIFVADDPAPVAKAADGRPIPHPASKKTVKVKDGKSEVEVPEGMVYVPAGPFLSGPRGRETSVDLDAYCIGRYPVTNAEFKAFLDATGSKNTPRYWANGTYPEGKANHPVAYVSLTTARAYAEWVGKETGRDVRIPTGDQWE